MENYDTNQSIIDEILRRGLDTYENIRDLFEMAKIIKDTDIEHALVLADKVKKSAAVMTRKDIKNRIKLQEIYYNSLLMRAPYFLDEYMIYIEKNREPKERFYLPRRRQFIKFGLVDALQELEDSDELELVTISMPPGSSKTTFEEFFMSWVIGRHPEDYNLFSSHSGDITRMVYDAVNNITSNEEYLWRDVFPEVKKESENAKMETINFGKFKPFKSIQCRSIDSKNAGVVRCNRYLFVDDLIGGIEEALSKPRLDKLWTKYSVDLRQRKKDGCKEIHIATRWSVHDVIGRLILKYGENSKKARFIAIPDIDPETGESNFDYDYGVGFTAEFFKDMEDTMDEISYKCLYKSEPIEREGLLYHEDDLRRYMTLPVEEPDAILGVCDTKDKGKDYLFLPCMLQYGTDYYLVDCICDDTSDYGIQYERCSDLIVGNKMQQCQFESNNGGSRVAYEVSKKIDEKGGLCNITSQVTTSNKETKIIVNADWVKKHVIFRDKTLYKQKDDYGKMMSFLLSYSVAGKNAHDDVPDGLAQFAVFTQNGLIQKVEIRKRRF